MEKFLYSSVVIFVLGFGNVEWPRGNPVAILKRSKSPQHKLKKLMGHGLNKAQLKPMKADRFLNPVSLKITHWKRVFSSLLLPSKSALALALHYFPPPLLQTSFAHSLTQTKQALASLLLTSITLSSHSRSQHELLK